MSRRDRALGSAAVLTLAVTVLVGVASVRADDDPSLARVEAHQLLASAIAASSRPVTISGTVATTFDLGVPELPASMGVAGAPGALASFLGDQRWKVWSSPDGLRVAHLLPAREQDLVVNHDDAWWWDSTELRAVHLDLAALRRGLGAPGALPSDGSPVPPVDPVALARTLIRGVSPCASVSVQGTDRVAGRDAYVLALTPLARGSLVGSIRMSIDAATRLPLRVEVRSSSGDGAPISAGFTDVSLDAIDPAMFSFAPPPGATVEEVSDPDGGWPASGGAEDPQTGADVPAVTDTRVFGTCLGVIVAVRVEGPIPEAVVPLLPVGGPLVSALAVERGDHSWVLAGLVDVGALEARAATLP